MRFVKPGPALSRISTAVPPAGAVGEGIAVVGIRYGASGSIAVPSGIVASDWLVALLSGSNGVPTLPAGFTAIDTAQVGNQWLRACYKVATGSETSVTAANGGKVIAYRNARGIGTTANVQSATTSTTPAIAALPSVSEGSLVLAANYNRAATIGGVAPGLTPLQITPAMELASLSPEGTALFQATPGCAFRANSAIPQVTMTIEVLAA